MRLGLVLLALVGWTALSAGQDGTGKPVKRYGIEIEEDSYPQKSPELALKSVGQLISNRRIDYLMAHLADPAFVDKKVAEYKTRFQGPESARIVLAFQRLVNETTRYFQDDPALVADLKQFIKMGEWKSEDFAAVCSLKTLPGRQVFMRKIQTRWFLENKQK